MMFEWPLLLLSLVAVPVLAGAYVLAQRRRRAYAVRFTNLALLNDVLGRGPGFRRHVPPLLFLLGVAALLVSLARPNAVIAVPKEQATVMLVLDVSASMSADDLRPSRMEAAKQAARAFVEALPKDTQVGLVSFNTTASVNAPLTDERERVIRAIAGLRANGGTAIGDGLNLALDQLAQRPTDDQGQPAPALVVLLSDGESMSGAPPEEAAARASERGVRVHTVGIGQRGARPEIGRRQRVGLDETSLQGIAAATGGQYFYAAQTSELERIYADLGSQVSWMQERTEITALVSMLGTLFIVAGGLLSLRWLQQLP
jgi:Ca-activated chloride channel family protein